LSGDERDGGNGVHIPGALADYACNAGNKTPNHDYSWDRPANDPSIQPQDRPASNGVFLSVYDWETGSKKTRQVTLAMVSDGLSNTFFMGEKHVPLGKFGLPGWDCSTYNGDHGCAFRKAGTGATLARSLTDSANVFGSYHPGICQFLM